MSSQVAGLLVCKRKFLLFFEMVPRQFQYYGMHNVAMANRVDFFQKFVMISYNVVYETSVVEAKCIVLEAKRS
jgi:CRISPR/Cas system-associated exonuclease Cas4 (RecB family)